MKKILAMSLIIILLPACTQTPVVYTSATMMVPSVIGTVTLTPVPTLGPFRTPTPQPTRTPATTTSPMPGPIPMPGPLIYEQPGPIYETVIQIPVGEDGIQYRGAGVEDMEPVGPNGLVVAADGTFFIGDVFGNRLMRYDAAGNRLADIDLTPLGILNISDLVGAGDMLFVLEISFKVPPERYRVNQLTTNGELVSQYDLPKGFHFEDGLYGLAIGYPLEGEAKILIELRPAGSQYYQVPDSTESLPEALPALPVYGKDLHQVNAGAGELSVLEIGNQEFESRMTTGGSLFLLSPRPDGSLYLLREDIVAWDPTITTDITIHYVSPEGKPMGVARYPLMDWYFHLWRFLTVGPDGNVYALITREASVDVLQLNFYQQLEPLISEAAEPVIASNPLDTTDLSYDCSLIQHLLPDSPEAQRIVQEFTVNVQQDWPTEYMAFEQLWSVDRLGGYAVIQGLVTQEESDIIVVQQSTRGFVMVKRYASSMLLPGLKASDIAEYFVTELPEVPPELFYCLDMSRFVGADS